MRPIAQQQNCPLCLTTSTTAFCTVQGRHYWRCDACALRFLQTDQRPTPAAELAHYRLHNNDINDPDYRRFLSRLADPLLQRLPMHSQGLDYGCGPGPALAQMLREAGHSVRVFDPLFANDADTLQQQYAFITCTEVVEHFHQPAAQFTLLTGMLQQHGWLALMTSLQDDDERFADWHYRRDPTHVCFYRLQTMHWIARHYRLHIELPAANVVMLQRC